jgi:predicted nucleic acid-binding protein
MLVFDTSSMIYAWDNYPPHQFPGLWEWMARQLLEKEIVMPIVALDEVGHKLPECSTWLKNGDLELFEIDNETVRLAMQIKHLIGVVDDKYHPKGVDENDLLIIASARQNGLELVSNEAKQNKLPDKPAKRKIPAVCAMPEVAVVCFDYLEFIKRSNAIFR